MKKKKLKIVQQEKVTGISIKVSKILWHLYLLMICSSMCWYKGFSSGSVVKNPPPKAGDMGSIPGLGRSPREGNGNPLQYSLPENPRDRGAWWATGHVVTKESGMTQWLNNKCWCKSVIYANTMLYDNYISLKWWNVKMNNYKIKYIS